MPSFSVKSNDRLKTCSWRLQQVFQEVIKHYDCSILEGHRGELRQNKNFDKGVSKVQWPDGKHNTYPSEAIDASPYPIPENWGENHWKDMVHFYRFAAIVKFVGNQMGVEIRWGGDWDSDNDFKDNKFEDLVHFELL